VSTSSASLSSSSHNGSVADAADTDALTGVIVDMLL
jgi:hypothetical protein